MAVDQSIKDCSRCGISQNIEEFHKNGGRRASLCKACVRVRDRKYYIDNREKILDSQRVYHQTARYKELKKANKGRWPTKNTEESRRRRREYNRRRGAQARYEIKRRYRLKSPHITATAKAKRRAKNKLCCPAWANKKYIKLWYEIARMETLRLGSQCDVDHMVPLVSDLVCGLHNEFNLQVLLNRDNTSKGNRIWPDMP